MTAHDTEIVNRSANTTIFQAPHFEAAGTCNRLGDDSGQGASSSSCGVVEDSTHVHGSDDVRFLSTVVVSHRSTGVNTPVGLDACFVLNGVVNVEPNRVVGIASHGGADVQDLRDSDGAITLENREVSFRRFEGVMDFL